MSDGKKKSVARDVGESAASKELDKELESTFPASDPPGTTQPGSGATGPEDSKTGAKQKRG